MSKAKISEREFAKICSDVANEGDIIYKHNPIGTREETLLWMTMSILISYLSLSEDEVPCFPGKADANTYRQAIEQIVGLRKEEDFSTSNHIEQLSRKEDCSTIKISSQ